jgi:hypothetical protein
MIFVGIQFSYGQDVADEFWSEPVTIYDFASDASVMVDSKGVFWCTLTIGNGVWVLNSSDGITWSDPSMITNLVNVSDPAFFQSANGTYWLVFVVSENNGTNIGFSTSADGVHWSNMSRVTNDVETLNQNPSIAEAFGKIWVAWSTDRFKHEMDLGEIVISGFNGTSWSEPVRVTGDLSRDVEPSLVFANGSLHLAWASDRYDSHAGLSYYGDNIEHDVLYSTSSDGVNWASPMNVTAGDYADDRNPSLAWNENAEMLSLVWQSDRDYDGRGVNYNVFMSWMNGTEWSLPTAATVGRENNVKPHVLWKDGFYLAWIQEGKVLMSEFAGGMLLPAGELFAPRISLSKSVVNVTVRLHGNVREEIEMENVGNDVLFVNVKQPSYSWLHLSKSSFVLQPGEQSSLGLYFDADMYGSFFDTLEFVTNDPENPVVRVPVYLTTGAADFIPFPELVAPPSLPFEVWLITIMGVSAAFIVVAVWVFVFRRRRFSAVVACFLVALTLSSSTLAPVVRAQGGSILNREVEREEVTLDAYVNVTYPSSGLTIEDGLSEVVQEIQLPAMFLLKSLRFDYVSPKYAETNKTVDVEFTFINKETGAFVKKIRTVNWTDPNSPAPFFVSFNETEFMFLSSREEVTHEVHIKTSDPEGFGLQFVSYQVPEGETLPYPVKIGTEVRRTLVVSMSIVGVPRYIRDVFVSPKFVFITQNNDVDGQIVVSNFWEENRTAFDIYVYLVNPNGKESLVRAFSNVYVNYNETVALNFNKTFYSAYVSAIGTYMFAVALYDHATGKLWDLYGDHSEERAKLVVNVFKDPFIKSAELLNDGYFYPGGEVTVYIMNIEDVDKINGLSDGEISNLKAELRTLAEILSIKLTIKELKTRDDFFNLMNSAETRFVVINAHGEVIPAPKEIFGETKPSKASALMFHFNEGQGKAVFDSSEKRNNGASPYANVITTIVRPESDYLTQWKGGWRHYEQVNDETPDGDSTYIYTDDTSAKYDFYSFSHSILSVARIYSVKVYVVAKAINSIWRGYIAPAIYVSGSEFSGDLNYISTQYESYEYEWTKNPATGLDWTVADIDNLKIGVRGEAESTGDIYCTQVYAVIKYGYGNLTWMNGVFDKAVKFEGGNIIKVPGRASLKPSLFKVEFWMNLQENVVNSVKTIISMEGPNLGYVFNINGLSWANASNRLEFAIGDGTQINRVWGLSLEVGKWYRIVGIYNGSRMMLYVNDELVGILDGVTIQYGDYDLSIGGSLVFSDYNNRKIKMIIDELHITTDLTGKDSNIWYEDWLSDLGAWIANQRITWVNTGFSFRYLDFPSDTFLSSTNTKVGRTIKIGRDGLTSLLNPIYSRLPVLVQNGTANLTVFGERLNSVVNSRLPQTANFSIAFPSTYVPSAFVPFYSSKEAVGDSTEEKIAVGVLPYGDGALVFSGAKSDKILAPLCFLRTPNDRLWNIAQNRFYTGQQIVLYTTLQNTMDTAKTFRVNVTVAGPFGNEFVASSENVTLGAGSSVPYRVFFKLYDVPSGTYRMVVALEDVENGVVVDLWGDHPDEVSDMMFNLANLVEIEDIVEKPKVIGNGDVLTVSVKVANYGLIPASLKLLGLLFAENGARYSINQTDKFIVKPSSTMTATISWDPAREEHPEEVPLGKFRVYIMLFNAHSLRVTKGGETKTNPIDFTVTSFERKLKIEFHYKVRHGSYILLVKNLMTGEEKSFPFGKDDIHEETGSFSVYFYPNERLEASKSTITSGWWIDLWATTSFEIYQIAKNGEIYKGKSHNIFVVYPDRGDSRIPAIFTLHLSPRDLGIKRSSSGVNVDVFDGVPAAEIPTNEWVEYSVKASDAKFHELIIQGYNPSGEDVEIKLVIDGNENEAMNFNFTERSNKWTTQYTVLLGQSSSGGFSAGTHTIKITTQKGTAKIARPKLQSKPTFDFTYKLSNQTSGQPSSSNSTQGKLLINIKGISFQIPKIPSFEIKGYKVKPSVGLNIDFSKKKLYLKIGLVVTRKADPTETYEEDKEGVKTKTKYYKSEGTDSLIKGHGFRVKGYLIFEIDLTDVRKTKIYVFGRLPIPDASVGVQAETSGELRGIKKPGKVKLDAGAGFFIVIIFKYESKTSTSTVFIGVDGEAWLKMTLEISIKIWKWGTEITITIIDFALTLGVGVVGVFNANEQSITIALAIYWLVKLKILMIDLSKPFVSALTLGQSTKTKGILIFREVSVTIYL